MVKDSYRMAAKDCVKGTGIGLYLGTAYGACELGRSPFFHKNKQ